MSKQTPAELAEEQSEETAKWLGRLVDAHMTAIFKDDYATIAHLHRALAGVMRNYQKFKAKEEALQLFREGAE